MKAERKKEKILIIILVILIAIITFISILINNIKNNNAINNEIDNKIDNKLYGSWYLTKQETYKDSQKQSTKNDYPDNYINISRINLSFCSINIDNIENCNSYNYIVDKNAQKITIDYEDDDQILTYKFSETNELILESCSENICQITYYEKTKG